MNDSNNPFGETIYAYTRQQAITDGVLVDLSDFPITKKHWKLQLCCTSAVWSLIEDALQSGNDLAGVLHDLYTLAKFNIKPATSQDRIYFKATVGRTTENFILHVGPGDTALPVLTLMLPSDD